MGTIFKCHNSRSKFANFVVPHTIATLQWLFLIGKTDTKPTELCLQQNIAVYLSLHNPTSPSIYLNSTSACNCIHCLPASLPVIHPLPPQTKRGGAPNQDKTGRPHQKVFRLSLAFFQSWPCLLGRDLTWIPTKPHPI